MSLISSTLKLCEKSLVSLPAVEFGLAVVGNKRELAILAKQAANIFETFEGTCSDLDDQTLMLCPVNQHNAASLRTHLSWLQPKILGLHTSAGMGDRLGIATPGHVRAIQHVRGRVAPIFAQQSIREMHRTGRSPQQVIDDATWGIFEEGWRDGIGADADHLKTKEDIDACLAAGFTFFTIDPGEKVNKLNQSINIHQCEERLSSFPAHLQAKATGLLDKAYDIGGNQILFDKKNLYRAILKYGRAIDHVVEMFYHLSKSGGSQNYEVEVSMDETEQPTSPAEHIYISNELRRMGVKWVSFAPRFIGRFEKGVDYIGDVAAFKSDLAIHTAIARQLGPYKLSLHSGSDKFSIYPIFDIETNGLAHFKTAGTSYLEALRTIASIDIDLFREIYRFALNHFNTDRQSYQVSAQIERAPKPDKVSDWSGLLEQFDTREILHVTFGSVLTEKSDDGRWRFYDQIMSTLESNREAYFNNLEHHFKRHLEPFAVHSIN